MLQLMLVTTHLVQVDVTDAGVEASLHHDTESPQANKLVTDEVAKQKLKPGCKFGPKHA